MKSWRPSTSDLVALCVLLTTVLSLAVVIGGRDKGVRLARAGVHRLDSAEVAPDPTLELTIELPATPLLQVAAAPLLPSNQGQAPSSVAPAVLVSAMRLLPPAAAGRDAQSTGVESIVHRPLRPSPGRAPPAL